MPGARSPPTKRSAASAHLEVRLARNPAEVRRAQRLRYRVFYKEGAAIADAKTRLARRDIDAFDSICDHLLVIDHAQGRREKRAERRRHLSPAPAGHRRTPRRILHLVGIRDRKARQPPSVASLSRTRALLRAAAIPQQAHRRIALAWLLVLRLAASPRRDDRLRQPRRHRSRRQRDAAVVPASFRARAGGMARPRAAAPGHRHEPHAEGCDQSERGIARAAAADQGLSAARRYYRRRRGDRPAIRLHRCADHPAGLRAQCALCRAFRRQRRPPRG